MPPCYVYACPIHECSDWGKEVEVTKSVHQIDTPESCPACGIDMTRQIARTSPPQFKGPGFYVNDYKRRGK